MMTTRSIKYECHDCGHKGPEFNEVGNCIECGGRVTMVIHESQGCWVCRGTGWAGHPTIPGVQVQCRSCGGSGKTTESKRSV